MAPQWGIHEHSTGHYVQLDEPDSNSRVRSKSHEKVLFAGELRAPGPSPTSPLCQVCSMSPGTGLLPAVLQKEAGPQKHAYVHLERKKGRLRHLRNYFPAP